jgi:DNA-binding sugar fermentation-stimulating protein
LHIVPVKFDLKAGIKSLMDLDFDWHSIKGVRNISDMNSAKSEYLYYVDQYDNHFVAFDSRIPSQLFRKVIANYIGKPELYDWKTNPNYSIIDATLDRFSLNY